MNVSSTPRAHATARRVWYTLECDCSRFRSLRTVLEWSIASM